MTDICCIGHITHDRIVTPTHTAELNGGTSFYFSRGIANLTGVSYKLVTSLAQRDMAAVDDLRQRGIEVDVLPSDNTVFFENKYGANMNNRTQRVMAKAAPFTPGKLEGIEARHLHLGSLLADDFPPEVFPMLAARGKLSVDAQGFLRKVDGQQVVPCDWANKQQLLQHVHMLKVNEHEIESLTGHKQLAYAARVLHSWGVNEVVMTLGSYGSVISHEGRLHDIPAYRPRQLVDATGCGDTYSTGYLWMRAQGESIADSGRFAAAMATLKLEKSGPFDGTVEDIKQVFDRQNS